jgi:hypothetical protein
MLQYSATKDSREKAQGAMIFLQDEGSGIGENWLANLERNY